MAKQPRVRTPRDYAVIEKRYAKFLEIVAFPSEKREHALNEFLDQIEAEGREETQEQETAPAGSDVSRQEEPTLGDLFTEVTREREGLGFILLGPKPRPAFPRRSQERLKQMITTFLDLLIAGEKQRRPKLRSSGPQT